jgi:hypothetical protein
MDKDNKSFRFWRRAMKPQLQSLLIFLLTISSSCTNLPSTQSHIDHELGIAFAYPAKWQLVNDSGTTLTLEYRAKSQTVEPRTLRWAWLLAGQSILGQNRSSGFIVPPTGLVLADPPVCTMNPLLPILLLLMSNHD